MVAQDDLCGVATLLVDHCYLYVAQQTDEHEDEREVEVWRLEAFYHFRRHAVHDVADERDGGGDGDGLVDEREVVAHGVLARCLARLVHTQHVVAALGERHEEREQEGHDDNPVAQRQLAGEASGEDAQHEAERHDAHVEYGVLLQLGAVGEVEHVVEHDDCHDVAHHLRRQEQCHTDAEHEHRYHQRVAHAYRQCTRRNGAVALHGVVAVGINVHDVVVAVYRRCYETVGEEGERHEFYRVDIEEFATEEHWDENEEVLYPLLRARKAQDVFYHNEMVLRG